jgi:hypothetical protein
MLYTDFLKNLDKLDSRDFIKKRERGVFGVSELVGKYDATVEISLFFKLSDTGIDEEIVEVVALGSPKVVVYICFHGLALLKMFKCGSMSFDDFCQSFIDAYSIPKLNGTSKGNYRWMGYTSPEGWKIGLTKNYSTSVSLQAVPLESERGFGR